MGKLITSLGAFFKQIIPRKVLRVTAVYAAACWVLIQVAEIFVPALHLPPEIVPIVIVIIIIGFPIAIILAWASDPPAPAGKYNWQYVVLIGIVIVIVIMLTQGLNILVSSFIVSPTQSIDAAKLKDDSTVTAPLQKTEKQDTSILEHKEDTTITFLEDKKTIPAKTSPEKKTKAKEVWHDVMVQFDSLPSHVRGNMRSGDEEYNENGQVTWKIEKFIYPGIYIPPPYALADTLNDGGIWYTHDGRSTYIPPHKEGTIKCLMKLKVVRKGDAFYYRNKQLFLNDTIRFRSAHYSEIGRITRFVP